MSMALIEIADVHKGYAGCAVLKGLSLDIAEHQVVCLIGASGCGKSTLLRCINGLEDVDEGEIRLRGEPISTAGADGDSLRRQVGIVFQSYNLFPHMTVLENLTLAPIRVLARGCNESVDLALYWLRRVGLATKAESYPDQLSGGQQQRIAIARALVMQPSVLLLDEITSALDPELVCEVLGIIRDLANDGMTMVLATHEMGFAREIASKICFLSEGIVHEAGSSVEIFGAPRRERTREFLKRLIESRRL
jgi:polar amino acid transport system ATP-binding protein